MFETAILKEIKSLREYCLALYYILEDNDLISESEIKKYLDRAKIDIEKSDDLISAQTPGVKL